MHSKTQESFFEQRVWKVVSAIPRGQVLSYTAVAKKAGFPGAARAVGSVMKKNFDIARPCHRVICSDGALGQYNRGVRQKVLLLKREGVVITIGRVIK